MADEEEKDNETPEEAPKKKSKIVLFGIIGLVLLLAGGGFFAYTKFMKPKPVENKEELKKVQEKKIGEMLELKPFVVNLSDPRGKRYLKLQITLELAPDSTIEAVTPYMPKMRDMVIMLLTSLTFDDVMTPEGKIRVRDEMFERFNYILKPHRIKNIYFTNFVVQ